MRTPPVGSKGLSCWAQQQPFDVEVSAPVVETYFREINAPQAVRAAWAGA